MKHPLLGQLRRAKKFRGARIPTADGLEGYLKDWRGDDAENILVQLLIRAVDMLSRELAAVKVKRRSERWPF